jgi:hypothetical protein
LKNEHNFCAIGSCEFQLGAIDERAKQMTCRVQPIDWSDRHTWLLQNEMPNSHPSTLAGRAQVQTSPRNYQA